jgi:hypothetical protein
MKIYRYIATVAAMLFAAPALADMTQTEQQQTLAAHNTERAMILGRSGASGSLRRVPGGGKAFRLRAALSHRHVLYDRFGH